LKFFNAWEQIFMANPIISRAELAVSTTPMTVKGVIRKTSFLLGLTTLSGVGFFGYCLTSGVTSGFVSVAALARLSWWLLY